MRKILMILGVCFALISSAYAQQTVTGTVTGEDGLGIPGVSVVQKGTMNGTITDIDGNYSLSVPANSILVFSFVGMTTVDERVDNRTNINVTLTTDEIGIDEVVVTAQGIRRDRKSLGYAISSIKAEELTIAGTTQNPVMALYGKAAGVSIRQSAAGPTGGININIRGAAGLQSDAKTRPLFVVDGVPIFDENTSLTQGTDYGSGINDINAEDIESIEILKGAKASVLYGSEGANGVVLITTKSGGKVRDRLNVNVSYQTTIEEPRTFIEFQNTYGSGGSIYDVNEIEAGQSYPEAIYSISNFGPAFDETQQRIWWDGVARPYVARPNNYNFLFSNGFSNQVNAAVAKSGDFGSVRLSVTNKDYEGIMEELSQKNNTVSFSGNFKFSNKLSVETSMNMFNIKTHNRPSNMLGFFVDGVDRGAPFQEFIENDDYLYNDPENKNFGYRKQLGEEGYPTGYYSLKDYQNFTWSRRNNSNLDEKMHLIAMVRPKYRINDWLSVSGQASLDYTDTDYTTKNRETLVYPELVGGSYRYARRNTQIEEYKGFVNFFKSFMDNRLDVVAMAGTAYKSVSENYITVSTASVGAPSGFNFPGWYHLNNQNPAGWPAANNRSKVRNNSFGENSLYGVFGVVTLTWDSKYTLELNARNDWSSSLPPDNNSYFYPGVAFTYDASDLLKSVVPSLQFGKFRASWADVGRDAPSRYYAYNSYSAGVISGTDAQSVSVPSSLFAGALMPERKRELEFGTEMAFFKNNRLGLDFSFYTNSVYDQIMAVPLSQSTGASEIKINAGQVDNWGYELQINAVPVLKKDFRWDMTFTTANQFSEVVKLYPGITQKNVNSMRGKVYVMAKEGERVGNLYGTGLKMDPDGNRIVSADGSSYKLDEKNEVLLGNVFPSFMGGFNSTIKFKGFSLYAHIDYSFGASMYSETNQWLSANGTSVQSLEHRDEEHGGIAYYIDSETNERVPWEHGQAAPAASANGNVYHDGIILEGVTEVKDADGNVIGYEENNNIVPVSAYYGGFVSWANEAINAVDLKYKNDYIKLREVSLAYSIPKNLVNKLKLSSASVSLFARNVGYLYKTVPNLDSEAFMGTNTYFEASAIPSTRTWGLKVALGF
ncbi:MAG: SusC/RagA family TonB-linked outer membrane protein [Bacteroidota bacterium]